MQKCDVNSVHNRKQSFDSDRHLPVAAKNLQTSSEAVKYHSIEVQDVRQSEGQHIADCDAALVEHPLERRNKEPASIWALEVGLSAAQNFLRQHNVQGRSVSLHSFPGPSTRRGAEQLLSHIHPALPGGRGKKRRASALGSPSSTTVSPSEAARSLPVSRDQAAGGQHPGPTLEPTTCAILECTVVAATTHQSADVPNAIAPKSGNKSSDVQTMLAQHSDLPHMAPGRARIGVSVLATEIHQNTTPPIPVVPRRMANLSRIPTTPAQPPSLAPIAPSSVILGSTVLATRTDQDATVLSSATLPRLTDSSRIPATPARLPSLASMAPNTAGIEGSVLAAKGHRDTTASTWMAPQRLAGRSRIPTTQAIPPSLAQMPLSSARIEGAVLAGQPSQLSKVPRLSSDQDKQRSGEPVRKMAVQCLSMEARASVPVAAMEELHQEAAKETDKQHFDSGTTLMHRSSAEVTASVPVATSGKVSGGPSNKQVSTAKVIIPLEEYVDSGMAQRPEPRNPQRHLPMRLTDFGFTVAPRREQNVQQPDKLPEHAGLQREIHSFDLMEVGLAAAAQFLKRQSGTKVSSFRVTDVSATAHADQIATAEQMPSAHERPLHAEDSASVHRSLSGTRAVSGHMPGTACPVRTDQVAPTKPAALVGKQLTHTEDSSPFQARRSGTRVVSAQPRTSGVRGPLRAEFSAAFKADQSGTRATSGQVPVTSVSARDAQQAPGAPTDATSAKPGHAQGRAPVQQNQFNSMPTSRQIPATAILNPSVQHDMITQAASALPEHAQGGAADQGNLLSIRAASGLKSVATVLDHMRQQAPVTHTAAADRPTRHVAMPAAAAAELDELAEISVEVPLGTAIVVRASNATAAIRMAGPSASPRTRAMSPRLKALRSPGRSHTVGRDNIVSSESASFKVISATAAVATAAATDLDANDGDLCRQTLVKRATRSAAELSGSEPGPSGRGRGRGRGRGKGRPVEHREGPCANCGQRGYESYDRRTGNKSTLCYVNFKNWRNGPAILCVTCALAANNKVKRARVNDPWNHMPVRRR